MTDNFKASNGIDIVTYPGAAGITIECLGSGNHYLTGDEADAAREFFRHERDEELGRWRWPENPDYVVYPVILPAHEMAFGRNLSVMVFHERTGVLKGYCREEDQGGQYREYPNAARAYFEAHPVKKPWYDAKPGEVWVFTYFDEAEVVAIATMEWPFVTTFRGVTGAEFNTKNAHITAARRIYPEETA